MKVTHFDPSDALIMITARIWGPLGDDQVSLALDTAATLTHFVPDSSNRSGMARNTAIASHPSRPQSATNRDT